jgi:hypothetical protein
VPKTTCLRLSPLLEGPAVELALALAPAELDPEELELELEQPAAPSTLATTTVALTQVAVRRLEKFMRRFVCAPRERSGHDAPKSR